METDVNEMNIFSKFHCLVHLGIVSGNRIFSKIWCTFLEESAKTNTFQLKAAFPQTVSSSATIKETDSKLHYYLCIVECLHTSMLFLSLFLSLSITIYIYIYISTTMFVLK